MDVYRLPDLPYAHDALEPTVSAESLDLHHGKHHAAYVKGSNTALEQLAEARTKGRLESINLLQRNLAFNVSGHALHSLFWTSMSPEGGGKPTDTFAVAVERDFGGYTELRAELTATALGVQGSGWAALELEPISGRLVVEQIHDHQSGACSGSTTLLAIDVWEHAYYLQYRNDRAAWIDAFFEIADWASTAHRWESALTTLV